MALRPKQKPVMTGNVPVTMVSRNGYDNEKATIRLPEYGISISIDVGDLLPEDKIQDHQKTGRPITRWLKVAVFKNDGLNNRHRVSRPWPR